MSHCVASGRWGFDTTQRVSPTTRNKRSSHDSALSDYVLLLMLVALTNKCATWHVISVHNILDIYRLFMTNRCYKYVASVLNTQYTLIKGDIYHE